MSETELTFLGTGDPLGSGGRLQTCFHVAAPLGRFLIDSGVTSMVAMRRHGIDRNAIEAILVTHPTAITSAEFRTSCSMHSTSRSGRLP